MGSATFLFCVSSVVDMSITCMLLVILLPVGFAAGSAVTVAEYLFL